MPERKLHHWLGCLDDEQRLGRPDEIRVLTFDDLARPGPRFVDIGHIVPIESARPGDEQVLAARGPDRADEPAIDLEPLADCPSIHSVVSSTLLRLRQPLPHITELLVLLKPMRCRSMPSSNRMSARSPR